MTSTKVAVVTGANKGIGLGIVRGLCRQFDGVVYLTARNEQLGREAVKALNEEGLSPRFHQLDIDDKNSIERFMLYLQKTYGGFDVLVNNAAIAFKKSAPEPFGVQAEETIRVNVYGTLNVSSSLIPLLRKNGKVIHVSSSAGHLLRIPSASLRTELSDPKLTVARLLELVNQFMASASTCSHVASGWPDSAYAVSKVAVTALGMIQQREFDESCPDANLTVNSVHPGHVDTDMSSHQGPLTIDEGAAAAVWLALLPPNERLKSAFVWHDKTIVDWVNGPVPGN